MKLQLQVQAKGQGLLCLGPNIARPISVKYIDVCFVWPIKVQSRQSSFIQVIGALDIHCG
jgi:hypothetical protein